MSAPRRTDWAEQVTRTAIKFLRQTREQRKIRQIDISNGTGIAPATLSHYERGTARPPIDTFARWARFLKLKIILVPYDHEHVTYTPVSNAVDGSLWLHPICGTTMWSDGNSLPRRCLACHVATKMWIRLYQIDDTEVSDGFEAETNPRSRAQS